MSTQELSANQGEKITIDNGVLHVPDNPTIPFIEGDGIGPDIWRATQRVLDAAIEKAYRGKRRINWLQVYAATTWSPSRDR